ncbi:MAG: DUF418 domain-containing protein [bacterium]|nr:DUF418 domain-containing protein [bacterium]
MHGNRGQSTIDTLVSIIVAHLCRKRFKRGPLEWLMRKITG